MKREAALKSAFTQELKRQLPGFMILLLASVGAPDRAIVGGGQTTFLEFKHATPAFDTSGLQELICMRLAQAGRCYYVIWQESRAGQRTLIVHPKAIYERQGWKVTPEAGCMGFNHRWLCEWLRKTHGV